MASHFKELNEEETVKFKQWVDDHYDEVIEEYFTKNENMWHPVIVARFKEITAERAIAKDILDKAKTNIVIGNKHIEDNSNNLKTTNDVD